LSHTACGSNPPLRVEDHYTFGLTLSFIFAPGFFFADLCRLRSANQGACVIELPHRDVPLLTLCMDQCGIQLSAANFLTFYMTTSLLVFEEVGFVTCGQTVCGSGWATL
jgi:hypothetical protein